MGGESEESQRSEIRSQKSVVVIRPQSLEVREGILIGGVGDGGLAVE